MQTEWIELQDEVAEMRRHWVAFQRGREPGPRVRPMVRRSWQRCQDERAGAPRLGGGPPISPADLTEAHRLHRDLLAAASPAISDLKRTLQGTGQVLVLCDPSGQALLVEGDGDAVERAAGINLVPGSDWSEQASGTNAMGTALAEVAPLTIFAAEHYLEELHPWACVAAPILHPVTGQVVGLLDLSGRSMVVNQHTELAVRSASQMVRAQLAARESSLREVVLAHLAERLNQPRRSDLAAVDRYGRLLQIEGTPQPLPPRWAPSMARILAEGEGFEEELPDRPGVRLIYLPVHHKGEIAGTLIEMSRPGPTRPPVPKVEPSLPGVIGQAPRWLEVMETASRAARTESTILITGETGTGKEVVARAIHQLSARAEAPFVAINCGALPPSLATSELFGYVAGAFTGANPRGQAGLLESAQGGTVFLDEVSELSAAVQVALLRVLQEREITRIGSHQPISLNLRVIAASNKELTELVARGDFREDLYYRLSVLPIHLPPLRERSQDCLPLLTHAYQRLGLEPPPLPPTSWQRLLTYGWPGNVRELFNLVEQAVALGEDPADLLPLPPLPTTHVSAFGEADQEAEQIRIALDQNKGNAAATARALGISRSTLYRKLELYAIRIKRQVE